MARKTVGYTELVWVCPNCNNKNPGLKKICESCGSPQPKDVHFLSPEKQELIQDQKTIDQIKDGPDIYCPYCGTRNRASAANCTQCQGDLKEGIRRNAGQVIGAYKPGKSVQVKCRHCGSLNDETHQYCSNCGGSLEIKPQPAVPTPPQQAKAKFSPLLIIAALGGIILCVVLAIILFSGAGSSESLIGTVNSVSWQRSMDILALAPVTRQDWQDVLPPDAEVQYCEDRFHHTQDQPTNGSVEVCGTPYVVDTGTGAGEIVQDCVYQVYQEYCEYTVMDWTTVDTLITSGTDNYPYWSETRLESDQQFGNQSERYQAIFTTDGDKYTYTTNDSGLFQMLVPGSRWELQTDFFNNIVDISPAN
ncbi:MAG: zinc ribbon domain-containing protein [Anaerolineae bacterium]|jgi:hypothetical protein|nr:zinc ribbon domain-containing protein [Anaerolineae bacterium]